MAGEGSAFVAGGVESISCVQNEANRHMLREPWLTEHKPAIYWPMLETAEYVAKRYGISRERQDEYGARSQQRAAAAAAAGRFADEIVPMTTTMGVADKDSGRLFTKEVTIAADEGIRADTTYEGVAKIKPALPGGVVAAGNASQFSDGAAACVVMSDAAAVGEGTAPAGRVPRLRGRRVRTGGNGHRPGLRRAEAAGAHGQDDRRHRPVGVERGLCRAGAVLPRHAWAFPTIFST